MVALTLLHSERLKLNRVMTILSAIGLKEMIQSYLPIRVKYVANEVIRMARALDKREYLMIFLCLLKKKHML